MSRRTYDVSEARVLYVEAPDETCEDCGRGLWIRWHKPKFVQRLDAVYQLVRQVKVCPACLGRTYWPRHDLRFALRLATYGTDVIVEVGERHMRGGASLRAIGRDLNERNVPINQTHVGELFRSYLALTKMARGGDDRLRERLEAQGGVVLMADGVQFDDSSPVLYMVWDALSGQPLFSERKSFKGTDDLVPLLERVKALDVPVLGFVSDKEKGLFPAVAKVFPDVPYQVCQNHFLKNCAAGMSGDLTELSTSVSARAKKIQRISSALHKAGVNSSEWETGPAEEAKGAASAAVAAEDDAPAAISEAQLGAELCAMAKHASRASGRAPLEPPEHVRHENLEGVRAAVKAAAAKGGAHTRSSRSSTRR